MSAEIRDEILLGGHISTAGGISKSPERAAVFNFGSMQVFTKNQMQWRAKPLPDEEIDRFKENRTKFNIKRVMAHASYLLNLATPKPSLQEKVRASFAEEMRRAVQLDIDYLTIHPGSTGDSNINMAVSNVANMVNEVTEIPGRTMVLLETSAGQGHTVGHRFEELALMLDKVEDKTRVAVCFDTCHVFAAGYDIKSREGYGETMDNFDSVIGLNKLEAFHLNDSKKEMGSRIDRHEQLGEGLLGAEGIANFILDKRFQGKPFIMETPRGELGYSEDISVLDNILKGMSDES